MRTLFDMDMKNYISDIKTSFSRPSVRGVYIKDNKLAMIYSNKYDYFKFPGGGIDEGESNIEALIREIQEEAGIICDISSIKEWGHVLVKEKGDREDLFIQDNFYYFYEPISFGAVRNLDNYEKEEGFELKFVTAKEALSVNLYHDHKGYTDKTMLLRENKSIELLMSEKYIK